VESITIKVDKKMAREIEKAMDPLYATKTEFIREAIREKIKQKEDTKFEKELRKYFGASKTKTTYEEERRIREEAGKKIATEHGISLE
jgi:metal-responsive CopG/Arc/MetJ family transcriptional regulator